LKPENTPDPVLRIKNLRVDYHRRGRKVSAVKGVDLDLPPGRTLGLIGESGCGKSSLGRALLGLVPATFDEARLFGVPLEDLDRNGWKAMRRRAQMVFQEIGGSLSPRMRVGNAVSEPLVVHDLIKGGQNRRDAAAELLRDVGLDPVLTRRFPHELSEGQRQRVLIARALATSPEFLIADEPIASLDVSVQAQILELLDDLRKKRGLTMIFISHDIRVVKALCDDIAVMYMGRIVEQGPGEAVLSRRAHPYTRLLTDSVPSLDPDEKSPAAAEDAPPQLDEDGDPPGCAFLPRCPLGDDSCRADLPPFSPVGPGHLCRCKKPS